MKHTTSLQRLLPVIFPLFLPLLFAACASSRSQRCDAGRDPAELSRLGVAADSVASRLTTGPDSQKTVTRQYLQSIVDRAAELDACGQLASAEDLLAAGRLAFASRELGLETVERAYRWSRRAVVADTSDRAAWRVMANAWDQLQVVLEKPQWFATNVSCPTRGRCVMARLDTTRVSDAQRAELGLRTLAQQRELVDSLNRARGRP